MNTEIVVTFTETNCFSSLNSLLDHKLFISCQHPEKMYLTIEMFLNKEYTYIKISGSQTNMKITT